MTSKFNLPLMGTLIVLSVALIACSGGEQKSEPVSLIPDGYEILASDTLEVSDKTYVINGLRQLDEDSLKWEMEEVPRPLMILEKVENGYDIIARNDHVIMCGVCGGVMGDPFENIESEGNSFTVYHFGGSRYRWTREISFQLNAETGEWLLADDSGKGMDSFEPEADPEIIEYTSKDSIGLILFQNFNASNY